MVVPARMRREPRGLVAESSRSFGRMWGASIVGIGSTPFGGGRRLGLDRPDAQVLSPIGRDLSRAEAGLSVPHVGSVGGDVARGFWGGSGHWVVLLDRGPFKPSERSSRALGVSGI